MNRNDTSHGKRRAGWVRFDWIVEIAILIVVTPALVTAVMSLKDLPIV